jgi:hypothetical protein
MISKKILISSVKIILYLDDFACLIVSNEKPDCEGTMIIPTEFLGHLIKTPSSSRT